MYVWVDEVVYDYGKVNFIFNNVGVVLGGMVEDMGYEDYEWIFGVNMWGVVQGIKVFLFYIK